MPIWTVGLSALVLGSVSLASPVSLESVRSPSDATSAKLEPAPACVDYRTDPPGILTTTVHITNWCSHTVLVRVDTTLADDSECVGVRPANKLTTTVPSGAPIRGLVACDAVI